MQEPGVDLGVGGQMGVGSEASTGGSPDKTNIAVGGQW